MKHIRFGSALLLVTLALSFGLASGPGSTTAANAPKCTCRYPNTDEWGVKTTNDCEITDCWVDVEEALVD